MTQQSAMSRRLRKKAAAKRTQALSRVAVALAIEDGVMDADEAADYLGQPSDVPKVKLDSYPGDEYYDRAEDELAKGEIL